MKQKFGNFMNSCLYFYHIGSLSLLADKTDTICIYSFSLSSEKAWFEQKRYFLLNFNIHSRWKKRKMTLNTKLVLLNKSRKPLLIFNFDPRVIFCFLKDSWLPLQKAEKYYSAYFLLQFQSMQLKSKSTKCIWYIGLKSLILQ